MDDDGWSIQLDCKSLTRACTDSLVRSFYSIHSAVWERLFAGSSIWSYKVHTDHTDASIIDMTGIDGVNL
jgi:hypothetical protein